MLKMEIKFDEKKVNRENKYKYKDIYNVTNNLFYGMDLYCENKNGYIIYSGNKEEDFNKAIKYLKNKEWFYENVIVWKLYKDKEIKNLKIINL